MFRKCPKCELNYISDGEEMCSVCRKALKHIDPPDLENLCIECGTNPALPGEDFCRACLLLRKRSEREANERDPEDDVDDDDIEIAPTGDIEELEIDIPDDIPETALADMEDDLGYDDDDEASEDTENPDENWGD